VPLVDNKMPLSIVKIFFLESPVAVLRWMGVTKVTADKNLFVIIVSIPSVREVMPTSHFGVGITYLGRWEKKMRNRRRSELELCSVVRRLFFLLIKILRLCPFDLGLQTSLLKTSSAFWVVSSHSGILIF
jgi:hypothetical protein